MRIKLGKENIQNPFPSMRVSSDSRRVEDLGGEIPAQGTPCGAVRGGTYIMLIAGDDLASWELSRAIGEHCTVLNQSTVGDMAISDEDGWPGNDTERDNGSVLGMERFEKRFELREGVTDQEKAGDDRNVDWARRELLMVFVGFGGDEVEDGFEDEGETE